MAQKQQLSQAGELRLGRCSMYAKRKHMPEEVCASLTVYLKMYYIMQGHGR